MADTPMQVHKVILSSKREVLIREPRIRDQELAAMAASGKAKTDNQMVFGVFMQKEMLKQLLVQIDGQKITAAQVEALDQLFTYKEYGQLLKAMGKILGEEDDLGKFQIEVLPSGAK